MTELDERYSTAIAAWQAAAGCVVGDLTPEQLERHAAWLRADCDAVMAAWIVRKRRDYAALSQQGEGQR